MATEALQRIGEMRAELQNSQAESEALRQDFTTRVNARAALLCHQRDVTIARLQEECEMLRGRLREKEAKQAKRDGWWRSSI